MNQKRILDEASRRRRQRKALEALEQDNYQDDPHADLKMSKRAPKFEESMETISKFISSSFIIIILHKLGLQQFLACLKAAYALPMALSIISRLCQL